MLGDIVAHLLIKIGEKLLELLGKAVGHLDLWFERKFGHCLSGRSTNWKSRRFSTETQKIRIKSKEFSLAGWLNECNGDISPPDGASG